MCGSRIEGTNPTENRSMVYRLKNKKSAWMIVYTHTLLYLSVFNKSISRLFEIIDVQFSCCECIVNPADRRFVGRILYEFGIGLCFQ